MGKNTDLEPASLTAASALVVLFANGRVYFMFIIIASLISMTILAGLRILDAQAVVAVYSAIIGGAFGHANGYVQGVFNEQNKMPAQGQHKQDSLV